MKKQFVQISALAFLFIASSPVSADYYQYVDEMRKPGQSVEEAKQEQKSAYKKAMEKKYADVRKAASQMGPLTKEERARIKARHKELERKVLAQRLDLTDTQQSKLEVIHQDMESFMQEKRAEIAFYQALKEKEFLDTLTDLQKEKLKVLRSVDEQGKRVKAMD